MRKTRMERDHALRANSASYAVAAAVGVFLVLTLLLSLFIHDDATEVTARIANGRELMVKAANFGSLPCDSSRNINNDGGIAAEIQRDQSRFSDLESTTAVEEMAKDVDLDFSAASAITLEEAYFRRMHALNASTLKDKLTDEEERAFKSRFLPNDNYGNFPILAMQNVCMDSATGTLFLINVTNEDIQVNVSGPASIRELWNVWNDIYTCGGNTNGDWCVGVNFIPSLPENYAILRGTTAHMLAYGANSMHNWSERTWQYVMAASPPFNSTAPYPINHYVIHRFNKWLEKSKNQAEMEQLLWQFRLVMEIGGSSDADFVFTDDESGTGRLVCFEKLILQQHNRERIDETHLPDEISSPGVRRYRDAIYAFFGINPSHVQVRLPPRKLRVLYYGRRDTSRRRVMNSDEVVAALRDFSRPPLEVMVLDDMLASGETNYTFVETMRIFSQVDILVIAHGANTWNTFLLPEGAGVVEIFGPCNWSHMNWSDTHVMHTWMHVNAVATKLKHDISNPVREAIPNPRRGNTTKCVNPADGVPDYTVDVEKLKKVIQSFACPDRPKDRIAQHWLHDWGHNTSTAI